MSFQDGGGGRVLDIGNFREGRENLRIFPVNG